MPPRACCISAVTLAEIRRGVEAAKDPVFRSELEAWIRTDVEGEFGDRILPVDDAILRCWLGLMADARAQRLTWPQPDALIAATAIVHGCTLVTRNTADFAQAAVLLLNPWQA